MKSAPKQVTLTHLDKVFWPREGYTKGDVANYYRRISRWLLPYLVDRPQSLKRTPNGIAGPSFFQKDVDHMPPAWVKTKKIYSESTQKQINYIVCQDLPTLLYLVNLGCIEINPWNSRLKSLHKPDFLIIDLDPEQISFDRVVEVAQTVHQILDELKLPNFCKTSGATGLHIYVPLGAKYDYEQVKKFAYSIVQKAHQRLPQITSLERHPKKRQRKVYLDYLQNNFSQTLAAPYSLRARPGAPVSTPLEWKEVKTGLDPLKFNIKTIFPRLKQKGDLWAPVLGKGVNLKAISATYRAKF